MRQGVKVAVGAAAIFALGAGAATVATGALSNEPENRPLIAPDEIGWYDAVKYEGQTTKVCGPIAGVRQTDEGLFVNLGRDYPDPDRFTIVLWGEDRDVQDEVACARGTITMFDGAPQIQMTSDAGLEDAYGPVDGGCTFFVLGCVSGATRGYDGDEVYDAPEEPVVNQPDEYMEP